MGAQPLRPLLAGIEPGGDESVHVGGEPATLVVWSPDYDGKGKALVRFARRPRGDRRRLAGRARVGRATKSCPPRPALPTRAPATLHPGYEQSVYKIPTLE